MAGSWLGAKFLKLIRRGLIRRSSTGAGHLARRVSSATVRDRKGIAVLPLLPPPARCVRIGVPVPRGAVGICQELNRIFFLPVHRT